MNRRCALVRCGASGLFECMDEGGAVTDTNERGRYGKGPILAPSSTALGAELRIAQWLTQCGDGWLGVGVVVA